MTVRIASINTALLDTFRDEATEGLDQLEAKLLELVTRRDPELVDQLFRVVHTIKGGAGTFGMVEMTRLAHRMESVLDAYRAGAQPTRAAVTTLLDASDALRRLLGGGASGPDDGAALEQRLLQAVAEATRVAAVATVPPRAALSGAAPGTLASSSQAAVPGVLIGAHVRMPVSVAAIEPVAGPAADPEVEPTPEPARLLRHTISVTPTVELFRLGIDPTLLFDQLTSLGELSAVVNLSAVPPFDELDPTSCHLGWTLALIGGASEVVGSLFDWVTDVCPIAIATSEPTSAAPPVPGEVTPPVSPAAERALAPAQQGPVIRDLGPAATVRVRLDKLDALMGLVGDLVVTQSTLCTVDRGDGPDRLRRDALDELQRLTRALQHNALQLRSTPIASVLDRFPRLVHDLAARLGKEIVFEVGGDGIELDKTVLERIGDPLVHLLRNSIDHGIERPDVREAAGKPRAGRIQIAVEQRGDEVLIEIGDDGRGLDTAHIVQRARERGLVGPGRTLSEDEIRRLIFLPGFSTAEQVSDVSGRGVGMDVVVRTIEELGGDVQIRSQLGAGTTITLRLPLTLAIIEGQLVRFGGRAWIVPLSHVVECARLDPAAVTMLLGQRAVYRMGDHIVPMIDLCERMALPRSGAAKLILLVEAAGQHRALVIDEVGPRQQVVIKSLSAQLARVEHLAGATVLGDGSVSFILDVVELCTGGAERSAA